MKTCHNSVNKNGEIFFTNIEGENGITDTRDLDSVCISRHNKGNCDIYTCEKRNVLFQLLGHNETIYLRPTSKTGQCANIG